MLELWHWRHLPEMLPKHLLTENFSASFRISVRTFYPIDRLSSSLSGWNAGFSNNFPTPGDFKVMDRDVQFFWKSPFQTCRHWTATAWRHVWHLEPRRAWWRRWIWEGQKEFRADIRAGVNSEFWHQEMELYRRVSFSSILHPAKAEIWFYWLYYLVMICSWLAGRLSVHCYYRNNNVETETWFLSQLL